LSNPYGIIQRTSRAITLGLATVFAKYITSWLEAKKSWPSVTVLVAVAIVVVVSQQLAFFFDWILNHFRFLRSILFRGHDVEGTWVDLGLQGEKVEVVGLTYFEIRDFNLCWYGENHNLDGQVISSFKTETSILDWPKARFWFKNTPSENKFSMLEGVCELLFETGKGGNPISYSGWGGIISEAGISRVVGWKITDRKKIKDLCSARTRAETLLTIACEFPEFASKRATPLPDVKS